MNPKILIYGAAGHALVVADILRLRREFEIVGFLDDVNPNRHGHEFCGGRILGGAEQLEQLSAQGVSQLIVAFGACRARMRVAGLAEEQGYTLACAVHPTSSVAADAVIGAGTVIKAGAAIDPGVRLGRNVIVGANATIAHEGVLEEGAHLSAGVDVGKSRIGAATLIGIGATVKPGVQVGRDCLIGAGAVVVSDIPPESVAVGVPARVIRKRVEAD